MSNPLSDQQLRTKFIGNAEPVIGAARERGHMVTRLDTLGDIVELVRAAA